MSLDDRVSNLIRRIYCAGEDLGEWDSVAAEVLVETGTHFGLATLVDLSNREYYSTRMYGRDDSRIACAMDEYKHNYIDDPSLDWASRNPTARFCDSSLALTQDEYLKHPFVKWNRDRLRATHWYVGYTQPHEQLSYSFSVHFPEAQGPGTRHALRLFRMLFDHLDCAMRIRRRPFDPDSERQLLLLDSGGNVQQLSNGAVRILATPDGLAIRNRKLTASNTADQASLDTALAQAASIVSDGLANAAVKITRPSGKRAWILTARPILSGFGPFGKVRCEILVQIHNGASNIGSLHLLQPLFDLTSRELQVMELLAAGHSVESLAASLKISPNTVRTHLRSLFAKTATSRQAELLQLGSSLADA